MNGQTRCRIILQQLKDELKTEKREDIRNKIASYGLEFNHLLIHKASLSEVKSKLNEMWGFTRVCNTCRNERGISDFETFTYHFNGTDHIATRWQCKYCISEQKKACKRKPKDRFTAY